MRRALVLLIACAGCYDFGALGTKPSSCAGLNSFMCDGFEDKLPAPPQWVDIRGSAAGTTGVDGQRAYRGAVSFHIHAGATNASTTSTLDVGGRVVTTAGAWSVPAAAALQSHAFLRAFYYLPALSGGRFAIMEVGRLPTANLPFSGFQVLIDVGGDIVIAQGPAFSPSGPAAPTGRWFCVELGLDNTVGEASVWLDGATAPNLTLSGAPLRKDPLDPSSNLNVNLVALEYFYRLFSPASSFDAWIDEIAVDSARIGCAR